MSVPGDVLGSHESSPLDSIAYPAIAAHGTIGDRRTAALVAADGTLDWLCLPRYDGDIIFGALLDAQHGGAWRLGPRARLAGTQRYLDHSMGVLTTWETTSATLELTDVMAMPQTNRVPGYEGCRTVIRRLRCLKGETDTSMLLVPRLNAREPARVMPASAPNPLGAEVRVGPHVLHAWASRPLRPLSHPHDHTDGPEGVVGEWHLSAGEEIWALLCLGCEPGVLGTGDWSPLALFEQADRYWRDWWESITYSGPRENHIRRSALLIHLLSYAPRGSLVAAPTTSLPEHIGGKRNFDYRFAWVRDASLSVAMLSLLGRLDAGEDYLEWLTGLGSGTPAPLQVIYGVDGRTDLAQHELTQVHGYRGSRPVYVGNQAYTQRQPDTFGYLADCAWVYLTHGGQWKPTHWDLVRQAANYVAKHWQEPDNGIWELHTAAQYLSGKVMSWVTLDRALQIAEHLGKTRVPAASASSAGDEDSNFAFWRTTRAAIHEQVMRRGWNERLGAFAQVIDGDSLDATALLVPLMGFLPADHPRVHSSVAAVERALTINGLVHRFAPGPTPGEPTEPLEEFEGAFLPCTFWLATVYAQQGRLDQAEGVLSRCEQFAGALGVFAEEADSRDGTFLGNMPLLFAQAEYARACLAVAQHRPSGHAQNRARSVLRHLEETLGNPLGSQP